MKTFFRILFYATALVMLCTESKAQKLQIRAKILFDSTHTLEQLQKIGIEIDHGQYSPGRGITSEFTANEMERITRSGYKTQVVIPDLEKWRATSKPITERGNCSGSSLVYTYKTPVNYKAGSYNGYFFYQEMLDNLDAMRQKYPQLITARMTITDTIKTHQGRPLYWVKMSDNPNVSEAEPEVLYTALHHAREPNSLSQMIFFMWYLLENYATNPEAKYILDNTQLYFVPCVNPDGYIKNETESPMGGGFWRKNLRNHGNGIFGVDLNRNYGFRWGYDDQGSSPDSTSDVHRGPAPFSEPETQMIKLFCDQHQFQFALNYHTFGNLLVFPWAYSDTISDVKFAYYGSVLSSENKYKVGTSTQTVGYQVNGSSDDYMYGAKAIASFTPEVGKPSTGFYPPKADIDFLNKSAMLTNLTTAQLPLKFAFVQSHDFQLGNNAGILRIDLTRYGLQAGGFTVSAQAGSGKISSVNSPAINTNLAQFESKSVAFAFDLANNIKVGDSIILKILIDNGTYVRTQTFGTMYTGTQFVPFSDPMSNLSAWSATNTPWSTTTNTFFSAPSSCTDSPNGDYADNTTSTISTLNQILIPAAATGARLTYKAKWSLENTYDYAVVGVSLDGSDIFPLCASSTGYDVQAAPGIPCYTGSQLNSWSSECVDLSAFLGQQIKVGFSLVSDPLMTDDGFYFDDLAIEYDLLSGTQTVPIGQLYKLAISPNPASNSVMVSWSSLPYPAKSIGLIDTQGRELTRTELGATTHHQLDIQQFAAGNYTIQLVLTNNQTITQSLQIVH
jgi:carboxypeptidase T